MTQAAENEERYTDAAPAAETSEGAQAAPPEGAAEAGTGLEQALAHERERSSGYLEELQRERASFINYRRRTEQEREQWGREANAAIIYNLLSVLDDFERARESIPADLQGTPWVDGLMHVGRKLYSTLELAGLKEIEAVGKPFNPNLHEAVSVEESGDRDAGTVIEEYRKGYALGDRVIRPSMVKVAQ